MSREKTQNKPASDTVTIDRTLYTRQPGTSQTTHYKQRKRNLPSGKVSSWYTSQLIVEIARKLTNASTKDFIFLIH